MLAVVAAIVKENSHGGLFPGTPHGTRAGGGARTGIPSSGSLYSFSRQLVTTAAYQSTFICRRIGNPQAILGAYFC
jgi:hypothetical protein